MISIIDEVGAAQLGSVEAAGLTVYQTNIGGHWVLLICDQTKLVGLAADELSLGLGCFIGQLNATMERIRCAEHVFKIAHFWLRVGSEITVLQLASLKSQIDDLIDRQGVAV
jgi:hypothetical protein